MKAFIKGLFLASVLFLFAAVASAEEIPAVNENISFNYGNNTFTITDSGASDETELTVILVKGDYKNDLSSVTKSDIYFVDQATGSNYADVFKNIGAKYTNGSFEPGVYTLITGGLGLATSKTKLVIGNVVDENGANSAYVPSDLRESDVSYGTIAQSFRVYENDNEYSYIGIGNFVVDGEIVTDNMGFILQRTDGTKIEKTYQSLSSLGLDSLVNVKNLVGAVEVGLQLSGVSVATDIVAIPYTK